jgi:hypothetical protein
VPHQKYGVFLYRPLSEGLRRNDIYLDLHHHDSTNTTNTDKLRRLFGLVVRQGETRALGIANQWEPNVNGGDIGMHTGAGGEGSGSESQGGSISLSARGGLPAYSESIGLLRRIKALDIPPLPPDTGHLIQPTADNRMYRY